MPRARVAHGERASTAPTCAQRPYALAQMTRALACNNRFRFRLFHSLCLVTRMHTQTRRALSECRPVAGESAQVDVSYPLLLSSLL